MAKRVNYRVGVIGAGAISQALHLPGYQKDRRAALVAFADPAVARHAEVLEAYPQLRAYSDYKKMLASEALDVVSVASPNVFHAEQTVAALRAGCHVLCEKPIATTVRDANRMIAASKKARRKLMIGFTHRMLRGPERCKRVLTERAIGKPFMIRVRLAHGGPYPGWAKDSWFYKKEVSAGGAMLDMGIHAIDLCHWLFGPIASVSARAATLVKKIEVDDNALLQLEFENGALGYIEVGWTSLPGFSGIEIYGTKGTLICDYLKGLQLCRGKASAGKDSVVEWTMLDKYPAKGGWEVEIKHWLDVLDGDEKLTMSGAAGRHALQVALAAYSSSETGRRVRIR